MARGREHQIQRFALSLVTFHRENPPLRNGLTPIRWIARKSVLGICGNNAMWVVSPKGECQCFWMHLQPFLFSSSFEESWNAANCSSNNHQTQPRRHDSRSIYMTDRYDQTTSRKNHVQMHFACVFSIQILANEWHRRHFYSIWMFGFSFRRENANGSDGARRRQD